MYHNIPYSFYPSYYSPTDGYAQALAEERAARDQYVNALQQQQEARDRAARARLARQAYHSPYNSYLSSSDDDGDFVTGSSSRMPFSDPYYEPGLRSSGGFGAYGMSPQQQRRALFEDQRRKELLELQKARERERVMELVEEERRKQLMEEELRRRIREEERQRRVREEEELRRKILEEERANVEQERLRQRRLSELEQLYHLPLVPNPPNSPSDVLGPCLLPIVTPLPRRSLHQLGSGTPEPRSPSTESERAASPKPEPRSYTPEQVSAALKIQNFYRSHFPRFKSLKTLSSLQSHFDALRSSFTLPTQVDFKLDASISNDNILTVPTHSLPLSSLASLDVEELPTIPSLAYTPTNTPLHQYYEELNRLLTKLDAIESQGDRLIRDRRRELGKDSRARSGKGR
ncbi:hypothetical protein QCA50_008182 [Cerrena zonata]|uniref:BAG domain-containing protein n=1 Tax=Cerrena zonata TaxID=2478898 RepID=A0AAW0GFA3_9APHY